MNTLQNLPDNLLLYDGECGLCNTFVQKVLKYNTANDIFFVSQESLLGEAIRTFYNHPLDDMDTVYFVTQGVCYQKSTAVLKVMQHFGWKFTCYKICLLVPQNLRDFLYTAIAKRRHLFFKNKLVCMNPAPEHKNRFLTELPK